MTRTNHKLPMVLVALACSGADGAIYRCVGDSGVVLYSQFPCANAQMISERQVSVIKTPDLTKSERNMLSHIEKSSAALDRVSRKRANQRLRQREKRKKEKTSLCRQALLGMVNLRAHKRSGYSLSESAALDEREVELRQRQSQNC